MENFSVTTRFLILGMLVWIILYSANMKVSPSAQGEIPLAVVKSKSLWVQVPPVSSGSVAYSNGYNNTNQQMQIPVTPHREKSQPKMPSKRLRLLESGLKQHSKCGRQGHTGHQAYSLEKNHERTLSFRDKTHVQQEFTAYTTIQS